MKDLLAQAVVHKGRVKSLGNFSMLLIFKCWNLDAVHFMCAKLSPPRRVDRFA